jgi:thioredoxin reductase (NADPH)
MKNQVLRFGAELAVNQSVDSAARQADGTFTVSANRGRETYRGRAVILALGSDYRRLGSPGEAEMRQAGKVSFCATCDGAFYRDKHVLTVGGGNTAVQDALYLATRFARKTTVIHRREEFRAQKVLVEELYAAAREHDIDIKLPYVVDAIVPTADKTAIDHVVIRNVKTDRTETLAVDGVFVFVGMDPNTAWLRGLLDVDENGYVPADPRTMKTAVPGVFVAGDCRRGADMQLVTACADGVAAALQLKDYFRDPTSWSRGGPSEQPTGW